MVAQAVEKPPDCAGAAARPRDHAVEPVRDQPEQGEQEADARPERRAPAEIGPGRTGTDREAHQGNEIGR